MTLKQKQDQWIAENPGMELPPDDFFETPVTGQQVTVPAAPTAPDIINVTASEIVE